MIRSTRRRAFREAANVGTIITALKALRADTETAARSGNFEGTMIQLGYDADTTFDLLNIANDIVLNGQDYI